MVKTTHTGENTYVSLFENKKAQCSLKSTIIDDEIIYILEGNGEAKEFKDYVIAVEQYIRLCSKKLTEKTAATSNLKFGHKGKEV